MKKILLVTLILLMVVTGGLFAKAGDSLSMWDIQYYTDSFGDTTDIKFITTKAQAIKGTFANSATSGSDLYVLPLAGRDSNGVDYFHIGLIEYGSIIVKGGLKYPTKYTIQIKDSKGMVYRMTAINYDTRLVVDDRYLAELFTLLGKGGMLKFYIVETNRPTTNYKFTFEDTTGFREALESL